MTTMPAHAEDALRRALPFVEEAVASGRIPGAVLGVVTASGSRAVAARGFAQVDPERVPIADGTVFDLASLTKPIATATALLRRADQGLLDLDATLASVIPDLRYYDEGAPERSLTIRACLGHRTFLPAVEPLYTYGQDPATLRAFILQRAWAHGPPVYSDVNYMLLGIALERVDGQPLTALDLPDGFTFRPDPATAAATERCPWRGRMLRGEVHDENAFALGGAAGHAGLFGRIGDVLGFAAGVLTGDGWSHAALAAVTTPVSETRTLGWEIRHPNWAGGQACSPGTIGHTGFTGTGLWIDRDGGLAWSLLTNRVHPSRFAPSGIMPLRRAVGEAACS